MSLPTDKNFLEERKTGIGGSDIAALHGLSSFSNRVGVYASKVGLEGPENQAIHLRMGNYLESGIARWFSDETGLRLEKPVEMCRHKIHDFLICHLDGIVYNGGTAPVGIGEVKNVDRSKAHLWGDPGSDDVPDEVNLQCQHNMFVASSHYGIDLNKCWVPACFGGNQSEWFLVEKSLAIIKRNLEVAEDFWKNNVLAGVQPPLDGSEDSKNILKQMFPEDKGGELLAGPAEVALVEEYLATEKVLKEAKASNDLMKNKLIEVIADNSYLSGPGFKFTYKKTKDGVTIDWKKVAEELSEEIPEDIIQRHSKFKSGYRSLRKKIWEND